MEIESVIEINGNTQAFFCHELTNSGNPVYEVMTCDQINYRKGKFVFDGKRFEPLIEKLNG